jgi:hypothetical protein
MFLNHNQNVSSAEAGANLHKQEPTAKRTTKTYQMQAYNKASKASTTELALIEDHLIGVFAQLNIKKPNGELEIDEPSCDSTTETHESEESNLPPPLPYFDRRTHAAASAPMIMQGALSRASSSSPTRGASRRRDVFQAKAMAMSMPNLHSSRSTHNRGIGYSVLSSVAECGRKPGTRDLCARIEEFESLLQDL